jgi:hypothetical protein
VPFGQPWHHRLATGTFELPRTTRNRTLRPGTRKPFGNPEHHPCGWDPRRRPTELTRSDHPCGDPPRGTRRTTQDTAPCGAIPESPERARTTPLRTLNEWTALVRIPYRQPYGHRLETTHRGLSHRNDPLRNRIWLRNPPLRANPDRDAPNDRQLLRATNREVQPGRERPPFSGTPSRRIGGDYRYARQHSLRSTCPVPQTPCCEALANHSVGSQRQPTDCLRPPSTTPRRRTPQRRHDNRPDECRLSPDSPTTQETRLDEAPGCPAGNR